MIIAERKGRRCIAMVMDKPLGGCQGVIQCDLEGCEWQAGIPVGVNPGDAVIEFLREHECCGRYRQFDPYKSFGCEADD